MVKAPIVLRLMVFLGIHNRASGLYCFKNIQDTEYSTLGFCFHNTSLRSNRMTIMSEKPTAVGKASNTADVTSSALKSLNPASEALLNEKVNQIPFWGFTNQFTAL